MDPIVGRFISVDPLFAEQPEKCGIQKCNLYSYAINNPLNIIDPFEADGVYIAFPDYKISINQTVPEIPTPFGSIGGQQIKWKQGGLGHAGVLLIDDKTGRTKYYEYGRYDDAKKGIVRTTRIPDVQIGKDGRPTNKSFTSTVHSLKFRI